jgi:two-component system response regulator RegX3
MSTEFRTQRQSDAAWRVAVVEDDAEQSKLIAELLVRAGHVVTQFASAEQVLKSVSRESFDLYLMDWNLPGMDGLQTLTSMRMVYGVTQPVLVLTSQDTDAAILAAFAASADDVVVKPVRGSVLMARVYALMRRSRSMPAINASTVETVYGWRLDRIGQEVTPPHPGATAITLSPKLFVLAKVLLRNLGCAVSRDHLVELAWGKGVLLGSHSLETHMSQLRTALKLNVQGGYRLSPIYGYGYRLDRFEPTILEGIAAAPAAALDEVPKGEH